MVSSFLVALYHSYAWSGVRAPHEFRLEGKMIVSQSLRYVDIWSAGDVAPAIPGRTANGTGGAYALAMISTLFLNFFYIYIFDFVPLEDL